MTPKSKSKTSVAPAETSSDPMQPFRGQTVLLIDDRTRSAGEIMAHGFKRSRFGPLIGTPTAGAVTSGTLYAMPGGLVLYTAGTAHSRVELQGLSYAVAFALRNHLLPRGSDDAV